MVKNVTRHGMNYYALPHGSLREGAKADGGLMTLSRYPIVEQDTLYFKTQQTTAGRGVLYAKI